MKLSYIVICIVLGLGERCLADPVVDFAKRLLLGSESGVAGFWGNAEFEDQPSGGYLLRFHMDITGDRKEEIFLSSSLTAGQDYLRWNVYSSDSKNTFRRIGENVLLNPFSGFYWDGRSGGAGITSILLAPPAAGRIYSYQVHKDSPLRVGSRKMSKEEVISMINGPAPTEFGRLVVPRLDKILLAEFLMRPSARWRVAPAKYGIRGQSADPADVRKLSEARDFGLDRARSAIRALAK